MKNRLFHSVGWSSGIGNLMLALLPVALSRSLWQWRHDPLMYGDS